MELAEMYAKHKELDQELADASKSYEEVKARVEAEKAQLDREIANLRVNTKHHANVLAAQKRSFELRMKKHEEAERFKAQYMPSKADEAISQENQAKRRKRNAEVLAKKVAEG